MRFPIQEPATPVGFVPVLAPAAARSQIVTLEDDPAENAELWGKAGETQAEPPSEKQLKPMYWYYPVKKTRPAADVFLTHPTAKTADNKPMPLLVGHFFGKGYVLFVGFDDTWRWRFNTQEKVFGRFWSQAVYTAGIPRTVGTKLTQLSLDATDPTLGKSGQIYARVFNENFQLLTADEIEATLEQLDADPNDKDRNTTVTLTKLPGQDGEYVAPLPFNKVGRFKLTVDPQEQDARDARLPREPPARSRTGTRRARRGGDAETVRDDGRHLLPRGGPAQAARCREAAIVGLLAARKCCSGTAGRCSRSSDC